MTGDEILKTRIKKIGGAATSGRCVLYVMSRDQRVQDNHALLAAQKHALARKLPLAVVFCLSSNVGHRSREQYEFMLIGLKSVESDLKKLNIPLLLVIGSRQQKLSAVMHHTQPDAVYFDFSPLNGPQTIQNILAKNAPCPMYVVDTHNIVPIWVASQKFEIAAYTIRPKIHKHITTYLQNTEPIVKHPFAWPGLVRPINDLRDLIQELLQTINKNNINIALPSGEHEAISHLDNFVQNRLRQYGKARNDPSVDAQSNLSAYLHFGQISALSVALKLQQESIINNHQIHLVQSHKMPSADIVTSVYQYSIDALLEELIVRKELADNFCYFKQDYKNISSAPVWAKDSLSKHVNDSREFLYSYDELCLGKTHDNAWNAAQLQLTKTGKMHGYMRMYWAKKVLEWTQSPQQAVDYLIQMNDFYSTDGGDPNGYAGIMWSIGGLHDRPWGERQVFGVVRYMNYQGLKRKFDIAKYEKMWI